jgi:hypothetical protein
MPKDGRWEVMGAGKSYFTWSEHESPSDSHRRWIEHYDLEPEKEKELIREGVKIFQSLSPEVSIQ